MKGLSVLLNLFKSYTFLVTSITVLNIAILIGLVFNLDSLVQIVVTAAKTSTFLMPTGQPIMAILLFSLLIVNTVVSVLPIAYYPEKNRFTLTYCFVIPGVVTLLTIIITWFISLAIHA